jgi:hypothetical protein
MSTKFGLGLSVLGLAFVGLAACGPDQMGGFSPIASDSVSRAKDAGIAVDANYAGSPRVRLEACEHQAAEIHLEAIKAGADGKCAADQLRDSLENCRLYGVPGAPSRSCAATVDPGVPVAVPLATTN